MTTIICPQTGKACNITACTKWYNCNTWSNNNIINAYTKRLFTLEEMVDCWKAGNVSGWRELAKRNPDTLKQYFKENFNIEL